MTIRPPAPEHRQRELDQRERGEHVDAVDASRGRRAGSRRAAGCGLGPSTLALLTSTSSSSAGGADERAPVRRVGDVAGERDDLGASRAARRGRPRAAPGSRASITRRRPRAASARASASPRPRDAPVMRAVDMPATLRRAATRNHRQLVVRLRAHALAQASAVVSARPWRTANSAACVRVGEAELAEDVAHVGLDGLLGRRRARGRSALFERPRAISAQHLALARGEDLAGVAAGRGAVVGQLVQEARGDGRVHDATARRARRGSRARARPARRP